MPREPTIAKIFSKRELYQLVTDSIENCGWNVTLLNGLTNVPLRMVVTYGGRREQLSSPQMSPVSVSFPQCNPCYKSYQFPASFHFRKFGLVEKWL